METSVFPREMVFDDWPNVILLSIQRRDRSQPTFKFIRLHRENICSNGWHKTKNHQWNQTRWGSSHWSCHIIVACDYKICIKYSPFQSKWSHASQHDAFIAKSNALRDVEYDLGLNMWILFF